MTRITYETLIAYASGDLAGPLAAEVEAFLAVDSRAAATVRLFQAARQAASSPASSEPPAEAVARAKAIFSGVPAAAASAPVTWWRTLERLVAALVYDSRLQPALAGFRGHERGFQLSFECEPVAVDLQAEPIERPGAFEEDGEAPPWSVMGQIESPDLETGCAVALVKPGAAIPTAEARADRHGIFSMEAPAGHYDLHIRRAQGNVVLPNIDMA